ncbi:MAG: heparinase II/III family protein [Bacteroidota bacterium]
MKILISLIVCLGITSAWGQVIPEDRVLAVEELAAALKPDIRVELSKDGQLTEAKLAAYFRAFFAEHFFYDYRSVPARLAHYQGRYDNQTGHTERALDHLGKYPDSTQWVLPFDYQNGEAVNAYALRHLARQHKMVDIAFLYFADGKDPRYIRYFETQMRSLNAALVAGQYEKIADGNGVFEVFRAGYRILNWLWIHNLFLNEPEYSDRDQLITIATLLQHGQHLYARNPSFRPGNHQTRGMAALALLGIMLRDFQGADAWRERAMARLGEHLEREINPDGFQFERSVHYHMSDINNYFYVYQLSNLNDIPVAEAWTAKLRQLFTTLAKIAYPDGSAPVLQDDTDNPWAEKNDISGAMTLGYLLFEDPVYGYFATDKVEERMYWYLSQRQVDMLEDIRRKKPPFGSLALTDTHYYLMREGWDKNDKVMIITAGLDEEKPDHQHGDMLGIQAMANGQVILPNYQVRYSLKDFDFFKNSLVKNVALVDDQMLGQEWTGNKGGSGFGKFRKLPEPEVLSWESNDAFDLFIGRHNGFEDIGVDHYRQVIFIKDDFWIVRDRFTADKQHAYHQVWQGHYTLEEGPNLLRATFPDASGVDILQIRALDTVVQDGRRGKAWSRVSKTGLDNFTFFTVIYPYRGYSHRIDESKKAPDIGNWRVNQSDWEIIGDRPISLTRQAVGYFFGVRKMKKGLINIECAQAADLYVEEIADKIRVYAIGFEPCILKWEHYTGRRGPAREVKPGRYVDIPK